MIQNRIDKRLAMLVKQRKEVFSPKWKATMEHNYYKALDVKSNSIKVREKKKLVNKNLMIELRKMEEKSVSRKMGVKIKTTVPKLLGLESHKEFFKVESEQKNLDNPLICFKLDDTKILKDVVCILVSYLR